MVIKVVVDLESIIAEKRRKWMKIRLLTKVKESQEGWLEIYLVCFMSLAKIQFVTI